MFPPQLQHAFRSATGQLGRATRLVLAALSLSAAGLVGLVVSEGYTDRAIPDPVHGTAVPTIGFGTTDGVRMGDTTTPPQALQRALTDIGKFEGALKRCVRVPLHQHEYDAYVDLAYNIGAGAFCNSTLVRRLNAQDYTGACNAILDWRYAGGQDCCAPGNRTCGGICVRRKRLNSQCLGEEVAP